MSNGLGSFNAQNYKPQYGFDTMQAGWNDVQIMDTDTESVKDNPNAGKFVITLSGPGGTIKDIINLWNPNPQTVEIAQRQLSAYCYATGVMHLNFDNKGAELRGARLKVFVEPGVDKKNKDANGNPTLTGYMNITRIADINGNEPGKAPAPAPQPNPSAPMVQQPGGGWANQPASGQATQQPPNGPAWGNNGAPPANPNPAPSWGAGQPQPQANPAPANNAPPWGR